MTKKIPLHAIRAVVSYRAAGLAAQVLTIENGFCLKTHRLERIEVCVPRSTVAA